MKAVISPLIDTALRKALLPSRLSHYDLDPDRSEGHDIISVSFDSVMLFEAVSLPSIGFNMEL